MTIKLITNILVATLVYITLVYITVVFTTAPTHADPPPPIVPTPGGSWLPGNQIFQPTCGEFPMACGFRYDPGSGTWQEKQD